MNVEYRTWIDLPRLPVSADEKWTAVMDRLQAAHGELGPIADWVDADTLAVVQAVQADTPGDAVTITLASVMDALAATDLLAHAPTAVRVEPVDEPALVAA